MIFPHGVSRHIISKEIKKWVHAEIPHTEKRDVRSYFVWRHINLIFNNVNVTVYIGNREVNKPFYGLNPHAFNHS